MSDNSLVITEIDRINTRLESLAIAAKFLKGLADEDEVQKVAKAWALFAETGEIVPVAHVLGVSSVAEVVSLQAKRDEYEEEKNSVA